MNNNENVGIYYIKTPTNKFYIGMTCVSFKSRYINHIKLLKSNKHHCAGLQASFNKYGLNMIEFKPIYEIERNSINKADLEKFLLYKEKELWEHFSLKHKMLNASPTGTGSVFHSSVTIKKIQKSVQVLNEHKYEKRLCVYCNNYFPVLKSKDTKHCKACIDNNFQNITSAKNRCSNRKFATPEQKESIIKLHKQGWSIRNISKEVNVNSTSVWRIINTHVAVIT